jgi:hypothetical protein
MRFAKSNEDLVKEKEETLLRLEENRKELLRRMREPDCFNHEILRRRDGIEKLRRAICTIERRLARKAKHVR